MNRLRVEPVPGSNPPQFKLFVDNVLIVQGSQGEIEEKTKAVRSLVTRYPVKFVHEPTVRAEMIEVIETHYQDRLSDWEVTFIESISLRETLTDGQLFKLNEIWDRVTADQ